MNAIDVAIGLGLFAVAAFTAAIPFLRHRDQPTREDRSPIRERRHALLVEIDDLDAGLAEGSLDPSRHAKARGIIEQKLSATEPDARHVHPSSARDDHVARSATPYLILVLIVAVAAPALLSAAGAREPMQPITGTLPSVSMQPPEEPDLGTLEANVQQTPGDLGGRLALAQAQFQLGHMRAASGEYLAVLRLDPTNPVATAHLGLLLGLSGHTASGLATINRAVELAPQYHEALLLRAILELRTGEAAAATRDAQTYLDATGGPSSDPRSITAVRIISRAAAP